MFSVIVPMYNEEAVLTERGDYFQQLAAVSELIFVDGGSTDAGCRQAQRYGRVMRCAKGRALQMNHGARQATRDMLLFLHADALLPIDELARAEHCMRKRGYAGGCFRQRLDRPGLLYRWIAWTGNIRAYCSNIYYGDQGIIVRRDLFEQLGGFPAVALCEDILFCRRLRKAGVAMGVLPYTIMCSARRWERLGVLKTFWLNRRVIAGLKRGEDMARLSAIYHDLR